MKLPIYQWSDLTASERVDILARPAIAAGKEITTTVGDIMTTVREEGDDALRDYSAQFDQVQLDELRVSALEFADAELSLGFKDREAILHAIENIRRFHEAQRRIDIDMETAPGVRCQRLTRPIQAVGLYVPAGSAPLPSAAMMLAIPAAIAGCPTRVLCTPPDSDGNVDPAILFAAHESGIRDIFKVGGAQAIAAMAYGTETVPKVDKLFGPGNAYVTEAKAQAASDPRGAAQDMPAGPSEVLVIADTTARPHYVAADLLSQAEHGPDSQVILLTDSASLIKHVVLAIEQQLESLSRSKTIKHALKNSALIEVATIDEAIDISNGYEPEHLIIDPRDARERLGAVQNAGAVCLGSLTPESLGDYCSGTNHVLPTYGYARNYSGLGIDQFCLQMSVQEVMPNGLRNIGPTAARLAQLERLAAHRLAVDLRLEDLDD